MQNMSGMKTFALTAAVAGLMASSAAIAQEKVTFGTNWIAQAEHGGFYQSVADGTYAECGLDVTIVPGGPQVNNRALLLAGKIDFHMGGNIQQAFSAVKEGIPLKVVAAIFQKEPQVIMTHPGQGLDTWDDLKTAPTLFIGDNGFQSFYQWMMKEHGFTAEQRKPYTFNPAPFIADPKSGQQGYVTSEPFAIQKEGGFDPNVFLIADHGYDSYSTTIETMQKTLDESPDAVKCFVEGSIKGWYNYLYGDNAAANKLIQADNPDMSDAQIAFSIDSMKKYGIVDSGDTETLGIGAITKERIDSFYDAMVSAGVIEGGIDVDASYTLDYVNAGVGMDLKQ